ncbi:hypothetical protein Ocin01_19981 [Orchesella cincta]|uniref:Uncharacterized protein n=1 Tax=Orchesella cincta TaxID=48709 RepID=A0A1D2M177_ORCCI|nr:hypothetical protein Ocin01_19981 [Orchesella cincta]
MKWYYRVYFHHTGYPDSRQLVQELDKNGRDEEECCRFTY